MICDCRIKERCGCVCVCVYSRPGVVVGLQSPWFVLELQRYTPSPLVDLSELRLSSVSRSGCVSEVVGQSDARLHAQAEDGGMTDGRTDRQMDRRLTMCAHTLIPCCQLRL